MIEEYFSVIFGYLFTWLEVGSFPWTHDKILKYYYYADHPSELLSIHVRCHLRCHVRCIQLVDGWLWLQ